MRRRRRNPEAWTGTEKQVAWAKSIRAEAEPVIKAWIKEIRAHDAANRQSRSSGSWSARRVNYGIYASDILTLNRTLGITDARFWIDNRSCGSASALIAAVNRLPRANPGTGARVQGSLLGIGTLNGLEIEVGGHTRTIKTPGRWLAWEPKARKFHICKPVRRQPTADGIDASVRKAHKKFHQEAPRKAMVVDAPAPRGRLRPLGLLKSLVYRVPSKMVISPEKNPYAWHHAFGDTGHKGGDKYPDRVKPQLCKDDAGNLFICRRKGNIFTVDTWLRG
jgi:hypothetical protein